MSKVVLIVTDSMGVGALPDAAGRDSRKMMREFISVS